MQVALDQNRRVETMLFYDTNIRVNIYKPSHRWSKISSRINTLYHKFVIVINLIVNKN